MNAIPILVDFDLEFTILLENVVSLLADFRQICKVQSADHEYIEFFEIGVGIYF